MASRFIQRVVKGGDSAANAAVSTRSHAAHRLQVGLSGIVAVVLIVGLADAVLSRADETEASAVPEAAATVEPTSTETPKNDPLAEAGVVPDLPASPTPSPSSGTASPKPPQPNATGGAN